MKLGDQFIKIMQGVVKRDAYAISEMAMTELKADIDARMDKGLDINGRDFAPYSPATVKDRAGLGLGAGERPVTLQRLLKRIKLGMIERVDDATAKLHWNNQPGRDGTFGRILYYHQMGMGKNPQRKILPESDNEFPKKITDSVTKKSTKLLDAPL